MPSPADYAPIHCPYCNTTSQKMASQNGLFYYYCLVCYAQGGASNSAEGAWRNWLAFAQGRHQAKAYAED